MDDSEADIQSNELQFVWEAMTPELQVNVPNSEEYQSTNTAFPVFQQQSIQNEYQEQNQSHSTEVADNDTLLSSPSNGIYLSPDNDSRRDSVRSMSVIGDNGIRIKQNIRRNGTLPNLSKGTSSLTHHQPFLHNYLQVPQSRTSQTARSNSSVASMQSDLESCLGDAQFSNDLIEGKAIVPVECLCW
uniref:Bm1362 n=1 Tax=Brugia malayi TaxID=6279 RepID=A0A0I9N9A8_BRUMA|nr:Bm1362 [Brugia malayi]